LPPPPPVIPESSPEPLPPDSPRSPVSEPSSAGPTTASPTTASPRPVKIAASLRRNEIVYDELVRRAYSGWLPVRIDELATIVGPVAAYNMAMGILAVGFHVGVIDTNVLRVWDQGFPLFLGL